MTFKRSTFYAILGLIYIFIMRGVNTLFPDLFTTIEIAQANALLYLAARVAVILFLVLLYQKYIQTTFPGLKYATWGLILLEALHLGFQISVLLRLLNVIWGFDITRLGAVWEAVAWLTSLAWALFFTLLYGNIKEMGPVELKKAANFGMLGAIGGAVIQTVGAGVILARGVVWDLPPVLWIFVGLLVTTCFILQMVFFFAFYRFRKEE